MGLFDHFRAKRKVPADPVAKPGFSPRCHHYTLAHHALRGVAFEHALGFFGVIASPDREAFLTELLGNVTEHCRDREPAPDFAAADIAVHPLRLGERICAVIQMPPPRAVTEAYFVAAVLLVDPATVPEDQKPPVRYVTLEYGVDFADGRPRTVLCEWTADGMHVNYGDGPPPDLRAFVEAVEALLNKGPALQGVSRPPA